MRRREKWIVGAGIGLLAALAVVVVIALTSVQRAPGRGCIDVRAVTVIGGSELYRCAAAARELCAEPADRSFQNVAFQHALTQACRRLIHMSSRAP